jgi:hypothetical protein
MTAESHHRDTLFPDVEDEGTTWDPAEQGTEKKKRRETLFPGGIDTALRLLTPLSL